MQMKNTKATEKDGVKATARVNKTFKKALVRLKTHDIITNKYPIHSKQILPWPWVCPESFIKSAREFGRKSPKFSIFRNTIKVQKARQRQIVGIGYFFLLIPNRENDLLFSYIWSESTLKTESYSQAFTLDFKIANFPLGAIQAITATERQKDKAES